MPSCLNKGCGKLYELNSNEDCFYHPGNPVFHDALKGYSCCSKKTTDFDSFIKIPGCTKGSHSNVPNVEKSAKVEKVVEMVKNVNVSEIAASAEPPKHIETFKVQHSSKPDEKAAIAENELFDDLNAEIVIDTLCKRPGCGKKYKSNESKNEECSYHLGNPIFHEGSKSWSCCPKKMYTFEDFLNIPKCQKGIHRFTNPNQTGPVVVNCRHDWYQTQDKIILSIFGKNINKSSTKIEFNVSKLSVNVEFNDKSIHQYETDLFQPIKPLESKYEILSSKIEIQLVKANGISWPSIEPNSNLKSFTTFGLQGNTTGTVGAKEPIISGDVLVDALK